MVHAESFTRSLAALNAFVYPRAVLRYQREILQHGSFAVACPRTGEPLVPTVCHVANNGDPAHGTLGIAYRLDCEPAIWLLAGSIKDGFPLTEAYLPAEDVSLWCLGDAYHVENAAWRARLKTLEAQTAALPQVQPRAAALLLGHPNFAHNLWNELPAIHACTQAAAAPGAEHSTAVQIKAIYEPLVPVEQLMGSKAVSVNRVEHFKELVGCQQVMATRLGATRIPVELRKTITGLMWQRRDETRVDPLVATLRKADPVVWLSVRLDARTLDNQQALLLGLVRGIAAEYPTAAFVLDGFSYPNDFDRAIYHLPGTGPGDFLRGTMGSQSGFLSRAMTLREREITAYIRKLQSTLQQAVPNTIANTAGMNLADTVCVAGAADFYVCHAGTLQHKIAWFYNIPGFVHSNTSGVVKGAQAWLARQLEDGVKPSVVSNEFVEDLSSIRTTNKVERNRDYHIRDVDAVVEQVLGDLARAVAGR